MGSGKYITRAIKKYGVENFTKEYLGIYDAEWKMNLAEKILVVIDEEVSYNLCPGGKGGWGYINETEGLNLRFDKEYQKSISPFGNKEYREKYKEAFSRGGTNSLKKQRERGPIRSFLGKKHSEETRKQMSKSHQGKHDGEKNQWFGTMWITNGSENTRINKTSPLPDGWRKGRIYSG
jgi:hypothetical protein